LQSNEPIVETPHRSAANPTPIHSLTRSAPLASIKTDNNERTPVLKSELVLKLAEQNPHLYQRDAEIIVSAILDTIVEALSRGDRVELRGFGAFFTKTRETRAGRNPRTGEAVQVLGKTIPVFKPGKDIRLRIRGRSIENVV
jgi:integration host factor subunit beta